VTIPSGKKLGRYEIRSKLGEGGMAEVYLAQDTKLDRKVALKILPAELAVNRDRMERFVREAKSAAALSHPNIAQIFEIGEHEGTHFIAMELVEGVTLRHKIHQERTELGKLLRYLQHVAEGLAKAHAASIVHRDLKPDNIMITRDGHTKILDFGLAKLIEPQLTEANASDNREEVATAIMQQHSTPGVIMGTVGYMSPEQAQGKTNEIDQRSDIFSFGCILYEAVTGHKAFAGKDVVDSLNKIIREPVAPISDFRPDAPNHLQRIVRRCLAKDPEDRYQTIKDVAIELRDLRHELAVDGGFDVTVTPATGSSATGEPGSREVASQTAGNSTSGLQPSMSPRASSAEYIVSGFKQHKLVLVIALLVLVGGAVGLSLYLHARSAQVAIESIAVMPFVNESGNAELEYLSDGMTETLIRSLSQLPRLNVKARSSVFRYKGKETDAKTIGKELNVQAILNGRVVQRGEQLTLSLELIDAQTENVIWSDKYDRKSSDLASLQNEIARDVSSKLKLKLSGADEQKLAKTYTTDPEAYRLYLQGRFYVNKRVGKLFDRAEGYFQQAIEKDPNFALGYVGLAEFIGQRDRPKAKEYIMQALAIDNQLSDAHAVLGFQLMLDYDFPASEREFGRAIELDPNNARAYQGNGSRLMMIGLYDEALASFDRAIEIEPTLADIRNNRAGCLVASGKIDEGIAYIKESIKMDPTFAWTHSHISFLYRMKGDTAASVEERARAAELLGLAEEAKRLRESFAAGGWVAYLRELLRQNWGGLGNSGTRRASLLAELGEKEEAITTLTSAAAAGDYWLFSIKYDPAFDPLRGDPRFQELLKKFNPPK
jgi:serine/threonine protein kinase/Flp pilus assembly protein TadD